MSLEAQQWSLGSASTARQEAKTHVLSGPWYKGDQTRWVLEAPIPDTRGLVSICPGVTAHILSIPSFPHLCPLSWLWEAGGRSLNAGLVRLKCPLQASVCQHTTEPGRKGSGLGDPAKDGHL